MQKISFLLLILLTAVSIGQLQAQDAFEVRVDGKAVAEQDEYTFNKDETYKLDVQGLKPNTEVKLRYRKAAVKVQEQRIMADAEGKISRMLEAPEKSIGVTCELELTMASGEQRLIRFRLKFRNLEKGQSGG
jgi:methionyl-tRNA formyltransferase